MEKNKTGKYFKYAIGEIVLVVIGILIALSINNWNEERKNILNESQLVKNIVEDLIEKYNKAVDSGIVGVHAQALHLLALRKVFIERLGKSPIVIEDEFIISLSGKINSGYFIL
jgi:hypothetical protein